MKSLDGTGLCRHNGGDTASQRLADDQAVGLGA
jgi:hypothetical protein